MFVWGFFSGGAVNIDVRNCQYTGTPFEIVCLTYFLPSFTSLSGLCLADTVCFQGRQVYFFQICWQPCHRVRFVLAERDAFDTLFDHAPDKLNVVKKVCRLSSEGLRCIFTVLESRFRVALHCYSIGFHILHEM